jgi:phosphatidylserine decarboxylase
LDVRYRRLPSVASGYLPKDRAAVDAWQAKVLGKLRGGAAAPERGSAVEELAQLIQRDGIVRMYVLQMIEQAQQIRRDPEKPELVRNLRELLETLDYIVTLAPPFVPPPGHSQAFPMSNLFVYMMMTPAGAALFRMKQFNDALRAILKEWCAFLDTPKSATVLNESPEGWLSEPARAHYKLDEFEFDESKPHWGWTSYNDFFHRAIKQSARPIAAPEDPKVIVSANDGTVSKVARGVKQSDEFWLKGQPFSLRDILNGDEEYVKRFTGGDVIQSFLSGANYHRWHAPIDGTVRKVELVEALMFSEAESAGYDIGAGTESLGYEASVNTRGLVYIESDDPTIGVVCVVPIGITEISSVSFHVRAGEKVKKGQELGWFSYGGSTLALLFEPGAIDHFTLPAPEFPQPPAISVNAQIAVAH